MFLLHSRVFSWCVHCVSTMFSYCFHRCYCAVMIFQRFSWLIVSIMFLLRFLCFYTFFSSNHYVFIVVQGFSMCADVHLPKPPASRAERSWWFKKWSDSRDPLDKLRNLGLSPKLLVSETLGEGVLRKSPDCKCCEHFTSHTCFRYCAFCTH